MSDALQHHEITCPHCWEPHTLEVDLSAGDQIYIEDCSVCCHPIEIALRVDGETLASLDVSAAQ